MRKIIVAIALLSLTAAVICAGIYWKNHQDIHDTVRLLKRAVTKDFHDPESAHFRTVQLQSIEGSISQRLLVIGATLLSQGTPKEVFSIFSYNPKGLQLCGEVNAKNGFGAYVGYKHFYISGGENPTPFIDTEDGYDFAKKMCDIGKENVIFEEPDSE